MGLVLCFLRGYGRRFVYFVRLAICVYLKQVMGLVLCFLRG